jgi:hypothetical protein
MKRSSWWQCKSCIRYITERENDHQEWRRGWYICLKEHTDMYNSSPSISGPSAQYKWLLEVRLDRYSDKWECRRLLLAANNISHNIKFHRNVTWFETIKQESSYGERYSDGNLKLHHQASSQKDVESDECYLTSDKLILAFRQSTSHLLFLLKFFFFT